MPRRLEDSFSSTIVELLRVEMPHDQRPRVVAALLSSPGLQLANAFGGSNFLENVSNYLATS